MQQDTIKAIKYNNALLKSAIEENNKKIKGKVSAYFKEISKNPK